MELLRSANFSGKNGTKFELNLYYDLLNQSVSGNYSEVKYYLYWKSLGYGGSGATVRGYIHEEEVGTATSITANENKLMGTLTKTIYHNSNGTGSDDYTASINTPWTLGSASTSGTLSLPTIPRASSVTATSGNIEESITINISRASSSFTHTLRYVFGNLSGTIKSNVGTSAGWTIPSSFYSQIPNSKTGKGTIYCDTYSGGTKIGTSSCTLNVGTSETKCKPEVSAIIEDTDELAISLTGDNTKLISYVSDPNITISATAKNSSTIKTTKVTCGDGKSRDGSGIISDVESGKFTITVTDSRGYSNSIEYNLDFIPYIPLTSNPVLYRPEPTTGEIKLEINGNYYNGNFGAINNSLIVKYRYKKSNEDEYSNYINVPINIEENTYSNELSLGTQFDYQNKYDFEIYVSDEINEIIINNQVSQGIPTLGLFENFIEMFGEKVFEYSDEKLTIRKDLILDYYTTDEIKTNKVWYNNKPIYRKLIIKNSFAVKNGTTLAHGISNIETITNRKMIFRTDGNVHHIDITIDSDGYLATSVNNTNIVFNGTTYWNASSSRIWYFIIEYTKTTDNGIQTMFLEEFDDNYTEDIITDGH